MVAKFYERNIAEGTSFLVFSIIFAILIRLAYFFHPEITPEPIMEGGYLWTPIASFFANPLYSLLTSSIILTGIAFLVSFTNSKYAFIRRRTLLPPAIIILLFSCMPLQIMMTPHLIAVLCIVRIVNGLFEAYSSGFKQSSTYKVSFYLALGSLFVPSLLIYFPVLWICLIKVRSFSFKSFLASVFSFFILYTPVFAYYYVTENTDTFLKPYSSLASIDWAALPILTYTPVQFGILAVVTILLLLIIVDNFVNSFKDKIRVRAFLSVLSIISVFSFLCTLFLNLDTNLTLFVGLAVGSLQIAHLFSLVQKKMMSFVFYFFLLIFVTISIIPFLAL